MPTINSFSNFFSLTPNATKLTLTILNTGFNTNGYAGHNYTVLLQTKALLNSHFSDLKYSFYNYTRHFYIHHNCSGYPFFRKSENALKYYNLTALKPVYTLTETALTYSFEQFFTLDSYCNQIVTLDVRKQLDGGGYESVNITQIGSFT